MMVAELVKRILESEGPQTWWGAYFDIADLKTVAAYYDENVLAPARLAERVKAHIEWLKTLEICPVLRGPQCRCGSVIPRDFLDADKRDYLFKWCEEHYSHSFEHISYCSFANEKLDPRFYCVLEAGHQGDHKDSDGTLLPNPTEPCDFKVGADRCILPLGHLAIHDLGEVGTCNFRDILQSQCVLKWGHEGDHQMVNGTNEANDNAPKSDPHPAEEFIAAYNTLHKAAIQFEDLIDRSFKILFKARDLIDASEKKVADLL